MNSLISKLDALNEWVGNIFSWFTFMMVLTICVDVTLRYVFQVSFVWLAELETYFFAIVILFGAGYAFKHEAHVRVDLFYAKFSERTKAIVNLIGALLFLLPWSIVAIKVCQRYAYASFKIGESSAQPGGLPAVYILKFFLVLGFVFLFLQAVSSVLKNVLILRAT